MLSVTATAELCENMRETLERVSLVLVVSAQKSIHKASDGDKRKDIWAAALLGAQRKLHYIYIHNSWLNCTSWYLKSSSLSLSLSLLRPCGEGNSLFCPFLSRGSSGGGGGGNNVRRAHEEKFTFSNAPSATFLTPKTSFFFYFLIQPTQSALATP